MVGPTTSAKPVGVRRSPRTGASVRTSRPSPRRERQPAQAARDAGEHRAGRGRAGLRRGGDQRRLAAPRHQLGHGRAGGQQPRVAGVHAAEQGLDEPVHDLVAEPGGDQLADRDVLAVGERPARASRGAAARRRRRDSTPDAATCSTSAGTPITERGSGRSAPWVQTEDEVVAGWTTGIPSSRARSTPSGRRASIDSAPRSTSTPADRPGQQLAAGARASPRAPGPRARPRPGRGRRSARRCRRRPRRYGGAARACAQPVTRPHGTSRGDGPSYAHAHHSPPRGLGHRPAALSHGLLGRVRRRLSRGRHRHGRRRGGRVRRRHGRVRPRGAGRRRRPRPRRWVPPATRSTSPPSRR